MTTAANLQYKLNQMREAGAHEIADPGSGGTVKVSPNFGLGVLVLLTDGSRTLQAAAQVPVGTRVLVVSSATTADVNGTTITDGGHLEFIRGVDASGAAQWDVVDSVSLQTQITNNDTDIAALDTRVTNLETLPVNSQVGTSYTLQASDSGKLVTLSNASAITLTVPAGLPVGFNCTIIQIGAGLVTLTPSSTTINSEASALTTDAQHGGGRLVSYATDVFNWLRADVSGT